MGSIGSLLEVALTVTVAFDLDIPLRQDAIEAQRVDESSATGRDAACLTARVSYESGRVRFTKTYIRIPSRTDPVIAAAVGGREKADVESESHSRKTEEEGGRLHCELMISETL